LKKLGLAWDVSLPKLPKFGQSKEAHAAVTFEAVAETTVGQQAVGD